MAYWFEGGVLDQRVESKSEGRENGAWPTVRGQGLESKGGVASSGCLAALGSSGALARNQGEAAAGAGRGCWKFTSPRWGPRPKSPGRAQRKATW